MKLSTKAQNLDILQKLRLQKSVIPKFFKYSVEEWIADKDRIINGVKRMNLREQGPEYGSIIRWKFDSHTWLDKPYPKEGKFAKMYQNGHVSQGFTQLQFNAHNLMFQSLLKEKKIKTIFLRSRINEGYDLED